RRRAAGHDDHDEGPSPDRPGRGMRHRAEQGHRPGRPLLMRRTVMSLLPFLGLLASGLLAACAGPQDNGDRSMETLKAMVLEKNPEAALRARQLGRKAAPLLDELSNNEDSDVRRTALNCFREVGGPEAVKAFLRGLADEDPQTAGSAANGFN